MKIVLVRHGRPSAANNMRVNSAGFARWVQRYNRSGVCPTSPPPNALAESYNGYYIVSSDLPRAVHSVELAMQSSPDIALQLFREMEIPRYRLPLRLNAWTWVYLNRVLWTLGVRGRFESYAQARRRAQQAADMLVDLASQHQHVIVFAHGYLNLHIRASLQKKGWSQTLASSAYWGESCLEFSGRTVP